MYLKNDMLITNQYTISQDTVKTTMQVTGKFSNVVDKVKVSGVPALYHGSLAAGKFMQSFSNLTC